VVSDFLKNSDKLVKVDALNGELDTKSAAAAAVHRPYMSTAGRKGKHVHRRVQLGQIFGHLGSADEPWSPVEAWCCGAKGGTISHDTFPSFLVIIQYT
jgi:hypothetical protein